MPIFDKHKSKIKMVVLTSGKKENITWFSIIDKDNQSDEKICKDMLRRFDEYLKKNAVIRNSINKIYFYKKGLFIGEAEIPK